MTYIKDFLYSGETDLMILFVLLITDIKKGLTSGNTYDPDGKFLHQWSMPTNKLKSSLKAYTIVCVGHKDDNPDLLI